MNIYKELHMKWQHPWAIFIIIIFLQAAETCFAVFEI